MRPNTYLLQAYGTLLKLHLTRSQQDVLKWLAVVIMPLDHSNRTLWTYHPWVMAIGRLAFPLFAFLIAYNTTLRGVQLRKYLLPLLVFGVV